MKKNDQDSDISNNNINLNANLEIDKIKTTNVNILLNRVRLDKKKQIRKKLFLIGLISLILSLVLFITSN